jgi:hypothetical protein
VRRKLLIAGCLAAASLALYSCSMRAAVTTDGHGHVVRVAALRLESSFPRLAVAMLVAGGHLALELRLTRSLAPPCVPST